MPWFLTVAVSVKLSPGAKVDLSTVGVSTTKSAAEVVIITSLEVRLLLPPGTEGTETE